MSRIINGMAACALLIVMLALLGFGESPSNRISLDAAELGTAWPLTIPMVVLYRPHSNEPMLETDERLVALNGVGVAMKAKRQTGDSTLWKDAENGSGGKADLGSLIAQALESCNG